MSAEVGYKNFGVMAKIVKVLGITEEVPASLAQEEPTLQGVISDFQSLSPSEAEKFRSLVCQ